MSLPMPTEHGYYQVERQENIIRILRWRRGSIQELISAINRIHSP